MMLFFDLDGPILDVSEKYYRVYADLVLEQEQTPIPKSEYWEAKRQRVPDAEILGRSHLSDWCEEFRTQRKARIETPDYLRYDRVWDGLLDTLRAIARHTPLVLVTLRHSRSAVLDQLSALELAPLFTHILSAPGDSNPSDKPGIKVALIQGTLGSAPLEGIIIGDTETDINAGKRLGFPTIAVSFGIRTYQQLALTSPDLMFSTPADLVGWLKHFDCHASFLLQPNSLTLCSQPE